MRQSSRNLRQGVQHILSLEHSQCTQSMDISMNNLQRRRSRFFSNTISFLYSHSDQTVAAAPKSAIFLILLSKLFVQSTNIYATLWGQSMPNANWIMAQTDLASRQSKNRCSIVSSFWQKQHVLLPCHRLLARLSLVKITPSFTYQRNTLILRCALSFHILLLRLLTLLFIKAW